MHIKKFITKYGLKFIIFDIKEVVNTINYIYNRDLISKEDIYIIVDFLNNNSEEKNILVYKIEGTIDTFTPDLNFYKNFVNLKIIDYKGILEELEIMKNKSINFYLDLGVDVNKYEYDIFKNKINKFILILNFLYKKLEIIETSFKIFDNPTNKLNLKK